MYTDRRSLIHLLPTSNILPNFLDYAIIPTFFPARPTVSFSHTAVLSTMAGKIIFWQATYFVASFQLSNVSYLSKMGAFPLICAVSTAVLLE